MEINIWLMAYFAINMFLAGSFFEHQSRHDGYFFKTVMENIYLIVAIIFIMGLGTIILAVESGLTLWEYLAKKSRKRGGKSHE